jgi:acyl carrier protein
MDAEILNKIVTIAKKHFKKSKIEMSETTHIIDDLGGDSLDAMEMVMIIEDEFKILIPEDRLDGVRTLGGLSVVVSELIKK